MQKFKVGDKVTPVDSSRRTFGHVGVVSKISLMGYDVVVKFDHLRSPATFVPSSLRHSLPNEKDKSRPANDENEIHVLVYELADDLMPTEETIFAGDINSISVRNAIVDMLEENMNVTTVVTMSQEDVDNYLGEAAAAWVYVYGLYDGNPFRITTSPVTEIAE